MWMKRAVMGLAVVVLLGSGVVQAATEITIQAGDVSGLRQALLADGKGKTTVRLASGGTYPLKGKPLRVQGDVVLKGNQSVIVGDHTHGLVVVDAQATVRMEQLTLRKGSRALTNHGTLMLDGVSLTQNRGVDTGSALLNHGTATLRDTRVEANWIKPTEKEGDSVVGGAVDNHGTLAIERSFFNGNVVVVLTRDWHRGVGFVNRGRATVDNSVFLNIRLETTEQTEPCRYSPSCGWDVLGSVANAKGGFMDMRHVHVQTTLYVDGKAQEKYIGISNTNSSQNVTIANSYLVDIYRYSFTFLGRNEIWRETVQDVHRDTRYKKDGRWYGPFSKWGEVPALMPYANAPVVNQADPAHCLPEDIRGQKRDPNKCDVGAFELNADQDLVAAPDNLSGSWVLEGHDKEGLLVESLPNHRLQVFWLGYGDKTVSQDWYAGSGSVRNGLFDETLIQVGGASAKFGLSMSLDDIKIIKQPMQIAFKDCQRGELIRNGQVITLKRLTNPVGVPCQQPASESTFSQNKVIDSGISGSWYNPEHPGQGLYVEVLNDNAVQAFYFGSRAEALRNAPTTSTPLYMISNGKIDGDQVRLKAWMTKENLNTKERKVIPWGDIILKFDSCNEGYVWFDGLDGNDHMPLKRLTSWSTNSCR